MQEVIFTKGIPASGKSTWAKEFCLKNPNYIRVCRDDLRNMRGRYWIPKQETLINELEQNCIYSALVQGYNVVVDATNLNEKYVNELKSKLESFSIKYIVKDFTDVSLEECLKRDGARVAGKVGSKVIKGMYYKYICETDYVKPIDGLPSAIICDLDGTLAIHNGRDPHDEEKCDTDLLSEPISAILNKFQQTGQIIFVSGRQDKVRIKTEDWLNKHGFDTQILSDDNVVSSALFMRRTGDNRNDAIVKKELFNQYIRGKYNIEFVLDDRNRVVEMWRNELGLKVLQVADGDF